MTDLSRKGHQVLSGKSKLYFWNLITIGIFYSLPVAQLVLTYQKVSLKKYTIYIYTELEKMIVPPIVQIYFFLKNKNKIEHLFLNYLHDPEFPRGTAGQWRQIIA